MEIDQERDKRLKKEELTQHSSSCGVWSLDYQNRSWNETAKILKNIEAAKNDEEW